MKIDYIKDGIVEKAIFTKDDAVYEAVYYSYKEKKVICFSVQCGCRIGCSFCGTGRRYVRDLTIEEMLFQVTTGLERLGNPEDCEIMSMSMGEPMDTNWKNVLYVAKEVLDEGYHFYISTVGLKNKKALLKILKMGSEYPKFGLQFSLHKTTDEKRMKLFKSQSKYELLSIDQLASLGDVFRLVSGNNTHYNYIVTGHEDLQDLHALKSIVGKNTLTCSVMCNINEKKQGDPKPATDLARTLTNYGMNVKVFNPAGQDTIGGGCGQLHYVQEFLKDGKFTFDIETPPRT